MVSGSHLQESFDTETIEVNLISSATDRHRPKRTKRACDKCSTSRTRCIGDGETPCQHCLDYGFTCQYKRERKKRGRAVHPKPVVDNTPETSSDGRLDPLEQRDSPPTAEVADRSIIETRAPLSGPQSTSWNAEGSDSIQQHSSSSANEAFQASFRIQDASTSTQQTPLNFVPSIDPAYDSSTNVSNSRRHGVSILHHSESFDGGTHNRGPAQLAPWTNDYPNLSSNVEVDRMNSNEQIFRQPWSHSYEPVSHLSPTPSMLSSTTNGKLLPSLSGLSQSVLYPRVLETPRPKWPGMTSNSQFSPSWDLTCRYPVLQPLLPHLRSIISPSLACDLLDLYFTEPSCSLFESSSPYVIASIFRKRSFLCKSKPRKTSRALLAAMIWVAAQTSDCEVFRTTTKVRFRICDGLFELCKTLLSLQESEQSQGKSQHQHDTCHDRSALFEENRGLDSPQAPQQPLRTLDDVLTYTLIGTVISGSETRKECLRWWTKAWALAKELNLNREQSDEEALVSAQITRELRSKESPVLHLEDLFAIEESREERRRTWWLLFICDRHLALSYNAPLSILDAECRVYQPLDETLWQDFDTKLASDMPPRFFGPYTTITGSGTFEYFLPLMAILGDIIDIHHLGRHPRLGYINQEANVLQVESSLENYAASLTSFEETVNAEFVNMDPNQSDSSPYSNISVERTPRPYSMEHTRLKTVIGYSKHILHVLHILLHGSWDPISMLDGADWITPNSFMKCATHAISAANAVESILSFDPELSFMPYLFGIYLLHGSFILLIFADRMDMATSETIIQACETTIRAHEVCVATLNTEYQRTFRKVLRSALYNVRGVMPVDVEQHKVRRRECLSMYQWAKDGKGLAI